MRSRVMTPLYEEAHINVDTTFDQVRFTFLLFPGPAHADDVNLILPGYYPVPPLRTQADKAMARVMVDIWESFVKTG